MGNKKLKKGNSYFDHQATSLIFAQYKDGVLIDEDTKTPLSLKEGAYVRITVPNHYIPDELVGFHLENKPVTINTGNEYVFDMDIKSEKYQFKVFTENSLVLTKNGNKLPKLSKSSCFVVEKRNIRTNKIDKEFKETKALTFNQAFRLISERYRVGESSHTCNIYQVFRCVKSNKFLDEHRKEIKSNLPSLF